MGDLFKMLAGRTVRQVAPPPKPAAPESATRLQKAEETLRALADSAEGDSLLLYLDSLIAQGEARENAAISNNPLMLVEHGRVMSLKELRLTFQNWRQTDSSPSRPHSE